MTGKEGCEMSQRPFEVDPDQTELWFTRKLSRKKKKSHFKFQLYRKSEHSYRFPFLEDFFPALV